MSNLKEEVGWSQEQWNKIEKAVETEFNKARVAAKFLPEYKGKIQPKDRDVPAERFDPKNGTIDDVERIRLVEIWTYFSINKQQIADEELSNALSLFCRAANELARLEDAIIFNGQSDADQSPAGIKLPPRTKVVGGEKNGGLLQTLSKYNPAQGPEETHVFHIEDCDPELGYGDKLVKTVIEAAVHLEGQGYPPPYALVFDNELFTEAHRPTNSMVMPIDRINPFVGGRVWKSGVLPPRCASVVSLAGDPIDLAVAVKATPQIYERPNADTFKMRVYEAFTLRLKDPGAAVRLEFELKKPKP